jgi:hypothetical protein
MHISIRRKTGHFYFALTRRETPAWLSPDNAETRQMTFKSRIPIF